MSPKVVLNLEVSQHQTWRTKGILMEIYRNPTPSGSTKRSLLSLQLCSIHFGGWKLDKKVGFICLTSYAVFLVFAIMIEFNVFGYVNAPMCTE